MRRVRRAAAAVGRPTAQGGRGSRGEGSFMAVWGGGGGDGGVPRPRAAAGRRGSKSAGGATGGGGCGTTQRPRGAAAAWAPWQRRGRAGARRGGQRRRRQRRRRPAGGVGRGRRRRRRGPRRCTRAHVTCRTRGGGPSVRAGEPCRRPRPRVGGRVGEGQARRSPPARVGALVPRAHLLDARRRAPAVARTHLSDRYLSRCPTAARRAGVDPLNHMASSASAVAPRGTRRTSTNDPHRPSHPCPPALVSQQPWDVHQQTSKPHLHLPTPSPPYPHYHHKEDEKKDEHPACRGAPASPRTTPHATRTTTTEKMRKKTSTRRAEAHQPHPAQPPTLPALPPQRRREKRRAPGVQRRTSLTPHNPPRYPPPPPLPYPRRLHTSSCSSVKRWVWASMERGRWGGVSGC
ncbi:hypothetical protein I4F81_000936 [Pyropia yezoensis]|uniref:Uncharacterized protein n=1 Tax=Pyropia yezoensis TaxID=2788 RepID=A0ACC3BLF3_PYRYE|nr:hypothetical protein I4F81_000936 [Neopyropia yezoensis]